MIAYCILVIDTKNQTANVSQEAYRSLEDAKRFIQSRADVTEIPWACRTDVRSGDFIGKDTKYIIKEIRVV